MAQTGLWNGHLLVRLETVPDHLRPVLVTLLSEATDAAACQRLDVSGRTYSRRLAELLDYFDSRTRFQAGVKLGLSGLVITPGHQSAAEVAAAAPGERGGRLIRPARGAARW
jgi:hypothetical protein